MKTKGLALLSGLFLLFINSCGSNSDQGNTEINNQQTSGGISSRPQDIPNNVPAEVLADLPPDPGAAGRATLEGIDSDGDGVRDDIQRYIAINYHASKNMRQVLIQKAKASQKELLQAHDKDSAYENAIKAWDANECLFFITRKEGLKSDDAYRIMDEFEAKFLNTYERSKAYLNMNALLNGRIFTARSRSEEHLACQFEISGKE